MLFYCSPPVKKKIFSHLITLIAIDLKIYKNRIVPTLNHSVVKIRLSSIYRCRHSFILIKTERANLHFDFSRRDNSRRVSFLKKSLAYLSPAPHADPHAAGFSAGLSLAPHADPHAAGFSPAPHADPHAAGFSVDLSPAPHAVPHAVSAAASAFLFHPNKFKSAIIPYLHFLIVEPFPCSQFYFT